MARQLMCISCSPGPVDPAVLDGDLLLLGGRECLADAEVAGAAHGCISLSSHLVHFGPAARAGGDAVAQAGGVPGGEPVRLQPPSGATLLSVSLHIEISRLIEASRPTWL